MGMLRLMAGVPESALSLEAPQGHVVADAAAYTEGRCLLLLQPVNDGGRLRDSAARERGHGGPKCARRCER